MGGIKEFTKWILAQRIIFEDSYNYIRLKGDILMNISKLYAAVTVLENGKYYSYVIPFSSNDNVICKLDVNGMMNANIYTTKKAASEVVECWNNIHKQNGDYMFNDTF